MASPLKDRSARETVQLEVKLDQIKIDNLHFSGPPNNTTTI